MGTACCCVEPKCEPGKGPKKDDYLPNGELKRTLDGRYMEIKLDMLDLNKTLMKSKSFQIDGLRRPRANSNASERSSNQSAHKRRPIPISMTTNVLTKDKRLMDHVYRDGVIHHAQIEEESKHVNLMFDFFDEQQGK